jgi:hypothetical protein
VVKGRDGGEIEPASAIVAVDGRGGEHPIRTGGRVLDQYREPKVEMAVVRAEDDLIAR